LFGIHCRFGYVWPVARVAICLPLLVGGVEGKVLVDAAERDGAANSSLEVATMSPQVTRSVAPDRPRAIGACDWNENAHDYCAARTAMARLETDRNPPISVEAIAAKPSIGAANLAVLAMSRGGIWGAHEAPARRDNRGLKLPGRDAWFVSAATLRLPALPMRGPGPDVSSLANATAIEPSSNADAGVAAARQRAMAFSAAAVVEPLSPLSAGAFQAPQLLSTEPNLDWLTPGAGAVDGGPVRFGLSR
jgi:hypothetical protein